MANDSDRRHRGTSPTHAHAHAKFHLAYVERIIEAIREKPEEETL